ncbi:PaaI family thioesterase [Yanghanlia caeni]|uniref:PaaI family thioesterase n=1 Tax=Yanghanlia caeni TaxID=3064283 RepID=A0ABU1D4M3_9BURK|nr:PaaI family thioesterase [Alcaligenaceae bacterium LG-2]HZH57151.1 PaaI family thioesterase [Burkholderiaceae bacterium]
MDIHSSTPSVPEHAEHAALYERIGASFARQNAMALIKARLAAVSTGSVEIRMPHWNGVEQQHGFVHGGIVSTIADSAAGYAAMSVTPEGASVLSVEFKLNMMAPAQGDELVARGKVVRSGRTLIVTQAEVFAVAQGRETLCALMQQTIMVMHDKAEK